ncbi:MAG: OprO/OprP family phosphate-selective porin [Phycisphaerales bacterium]|nr:OprO/OprP family phosphate-selective porin [Phycisphaerales bacterium]MCI0629371.1 OprO/OprP family phosphate-selective porin [Phycisphaerales bacterium]
MKTATISWDQARLPARGGQLLVIIASLCGAHNGQAAPRSNDQVVLSAPPADSTNPSLRRRLEELEARIARLQSTPEEIWLSEQRASAVRELVAEVLHDAESRASLLADKPSAGYDGDFFIRSGDGKFLLEVSGELQVRYTFNHQNESLEDRNRGGFEVRRLKIDFDGYVMGPKVGYSVTVGFDDDTGDFELQDASVRFRMSDQWSLRMGKARPPFLREEQVSSKRQLLVERSLVAREFRLRRALGAFLIFQTPTTRVRGGLSDNSADLFGDEQWTFNARAEQLFLGEWSQVDDFNSFRDDQTSAAIGAGFAYRTDDFVDPNEDDEKSWRWTADASVGTGGATAFVAVVGNHVTEEDGEKFNEIGIVVQGGIFVTKNWEVFAQYAWGDADRPIPDLSVVTVGATHFFAKHDLQWTTDVGYGLQGVAGFWASSGAGWRADLPGQEGQVVVRSQFQLLF